MAGKREREKRGGRRGGGEEGGKGIREEKNVFKKKTKRREEGKAIKEEKKKKGRKKKREIETKTRPRFLPRGRGVIGIASIRNCKSHSKPPTAPRQKNQEHKIENHKPHDMIPAAIK